MTKLQQLLLKIKELREANKKDFAEYKDDLAKMPGDVSERIAKRLEELEGKDGKPGICAEADKLEKLYAAQSDNEKALTELGEFKHHSGDSSKEGEEPGIDNKGQKFIQEEKRIARLPMYTSLKNFKDRAHSDAPEVRAYRFAQWFVATIVKSMFRTGEEPALVQKAVKYCKDFNILVKAQSEGTNTAGGYLVPLEFSRDIIDLREMYGVFRRFAKVVPMMSDQKLVPRRRSGLTVYNPGEGSAITESQKGWDMVTLAAKKFAVLALYSSELDEDSMINIGDDLAGEISYAFSNKEDECGFNGDGTSTYFGITGARKKLQNLSATVGDIAGLVVATGTGYASSWGATVLTDFNAVIGKLPQFAETPRAGWFCHKAYWATVMQKLALAAGGVTASEIREGSRTPTFLGYPVNIAQVLPKSPAVSQIPVLLGDLYLASTFGDRRAVTLAYSTDYKFAEDQLAIRGIQRVDINVHDVGNADGTAANRVEGPIVGLITATS